MYSILLYYKYIPITDPERLKADQIDLCAKLDLKGRIIVSREGINGTVEGTKGSIQKYLEEMRRDVRFADIDFKESESNGKSFPRLSVKNRPEIVSLGTGTETGEFKKGTYLSPEELQAWYDEGKEFTVIDMRNDYEHEIGHFENSVRLPIKNFRDVPSATDKLIDLKDKVVVNVCTGGVRCEKASSHLIKKGFKNVYQLHGGIVRYLEKFPDKKFKGSLYVFDGRVATKYASPDKHVVVGRCATCGITSERCVNCDYPECHGHFVCCESCSQNGVFCSETCRDKMISRVV
ncbi:MAG TPA: rhodanese-related sulfurtransferase [Candidatus Nanoarchaeia archaeon]|nr:rhodanese-related sulfurtransferase [Candidatus Nanoarchaeia archaeon]